MRAVLHNPVMVGVSQQVASMHISLLCPACHRGLNVPYAAIDSEHNCPLCNAQFRVPQPGDAVTDFTAAPPNSTQSIPEKAGHISPPPSRDAAIVILAVLFMFFACLKAVSGVQLWRQHASTNTAAQKTGGAPAGTIASSIHDLQVKTAASQRMNALFAFLESLILSVTACFLFRGSFRLFCVFGSCLACLTMPLGTALGLASLVILRRRQSFHAIPQITAG